MRSFRDPVSFHLVRLSSSVSSIPPCLLYLPHVTADREKQGVEDRGSSHGSDVQVAKITSALFPLARTFHWPTTLQERLGNRLFPWARADNVLSLPHLDSQVTSVLLWFWDQDLSSSLKSSDSYPWLSLPLWSPPWNISETIWGLLCSL